MIPEEVEAKSLRVKEVEATTKNEDVEKDFLEIDKIKTCHNLETYQRQTRRWKDQKVHLREIVVGDLVLKKKHNAENLGKLTEKWEGPFIAIRSARPDSFHLAKENGEELPHSWNIDSLRKFYPQKLLDSLFLFQSFVKILRVCEQ